MPIAIRLNACNDRNGNPRRVFVVLSEDGRILDTRDEGYDGSRAVTEFWPDVEIGVTFMTTPAEYRDTVKFAHDHPAPTPGEVVRHCHENTGKHGHNGNNGPALGRSL